MLNVAEVVLPADKCLSPPASCQARSSEPVLFLKQRMRTCLSRPMHWDHGITGSEVYPPCIAFGDFFFFAEVRWTERNRSRDKPRKAGTLVFMISCASQFIHRCIARDFIPSGIFNSYKFLLQQRVVATSWIKCTSITGSFSLRIVSCSCWIAMSDMSKITMLYLPSIDFRYTKKCVCMIFFFFFCKRERYILALRHSAGQSEYLIKRQRYWRVPGTCWQSTLKLKSPRAENSLIWGREVTKNLSFLPLYTTNFNQLWSFVRRGKFTVMEYHACPVQNLFVYICFIIHYFCLC